MNEPTEAERTSAAGAEPEPGSPTLLTPVTAGERVEILDVLRGFAIFGILLVNMALFFSPMHLQVLGEPSVTGPFDELARKAIVFFAQGKFYSLFSFLFGMGLAIQMERAAARGRKIAGFFARRMFWLMLIGLAHIFLIWFGDILFLYSLMGFVLILFRNAKPKTLAVWTVILLLIPIALGGYQVGRVLLLQRSAPAAAELALQPVQEYLDAARDGIQPTVEAYSSGTWREIFDARAAEWWLIFPFILVNFAWVVLALFVLGLNFGRRRFFQRLDENLPAIRRWIWRLGAIGLVCNLLLVYLSDRVQPANPTPGSLALNVVYGLGPPIQSAFYVCAICLLWQRPGWRRALGRLAPVGRMALTNYLMHSVVFTTISYHYGFGLYGQIDYLEGLALTVAMFALQIPLSTWWLSRFRFGPLECLWRSLAYWRLQPMRR